MSEKEWPDLDQWTKADADIPKTRSEAEAFAAYRRGWNDALDALMEYYSQHLIRQTEEVRKETRREILRVVDQCAEEGMEAADVYCVLEKNDE